MNFDVAKQLIRYYVQKVERERQSTTLLLNQYRERCAASVGTTEEIDRLERAVKHDTLATDVARESLNPIV